MRRPEEGLAPRPDARTEASEPEARDVTGTSDSRPPAPMQALIQRIKREVEPEAWAASGGAAMLPSGDRNLVVKAPRSVLERIGDLLDRLGEGALQRALQEAAEDPATPASHPVERQAAEEEVRRLLRAMHAQWGRLVQALKAHQADRNADALRLLDEVLAREPDHAVAAEFHKQVAVGPPQGTLIDLDHAGGMEPSPFSEIWGRVSGLGPGRISSWPRRWPSPTTIEALDTARRRAGMERCTFLGAERERRLGMHAPPLRLEGMALQEVLERLSLECLIDIEAASPPMHPPEPLGPLVPRGPTLRDLLEAVAGRLTPEHRLVSYSTVLRLVPPDDAPRLYVEIFDVGDVLQEDDVLQEEPAR